MAKKKNTEDPELVSENEEIIEESVIPEIETLPVPSDMSEIIDIEFLQKQLFKDAGVPKELIADAPTVLVNSTIKYYFELEHKYGKVYLSVSKRYSKDFHVGVFKFDNIEQIKHDSKIKSFLPLIDVPEFLKNFKYK